MSLVSDLPSDRLCKYLGGVYKASRDGFNCLSLEAILDASADAA